MPIPNDYRDIVDMLLKKTDEGNVYWNNEKFDISVSIDGSRFGMWAGNDENTEEPFVSFGLQDSKGVTLDSWFVEENEGSDYTLMLRFYQAAKRHAAGVPNKLEQLRRSIASSERIGASEEL